MEHLNDTDIARLIYLGILVLVLGGSYLTLRQQSLSQVVQQAAIWAFIFIGAITAFALWDDVKQSFDLQSSLSASDGTQVVRAPRAPDGHYYLRLEVNGTPLRFVVDTGASAIVLSRQDAERVGLNVAQLPFLGRASTANGEVSTAFVRLRDVRVGEITDSNVEALVNGAEMETSLLGMTYLERFGRISIENGSLTLYR